MNTPITTSASPASVTVGTAVTAGDSATLSSGNNPTGSVFFTLYSDAACTIPVTGMSGSGAIIALDDTTDMRKILHNINSFYAHESCGQCTPCREGNNWMKKLSDRMARGDRREGDVELMLSVSKQIEGKTICAFGEACSWPVQGIR